ncbi:MAG: ATP-binding cassette domain-containing protein [Defluviitaleaceae bacterium]|nr:ATP-binding cassette domain-containing protein [Defluviitaleaceae bacterium]
MENIISVSNLEKSFKSLHVLKGVSFEVKKGSIFALLGSNGAGKTTIVKILSTLSKPNGGDAKICGYDVTKHASDVRACISLTGQYAAVDEALTGRENLQIIGALNKLKNVNQRADELLAKFRLEDDCKRQVLTYSGGMRRRLDIAMSLMGSPKVLFLDEPTTGLDPQNRIAMWDMVKELANSGTTIFLTTQYLEEAEYLADHIAILHEGKITAEGTPTELKNVLPQQSILLDFNTSEDMEKACTTLKGYTISPVKENDKTIDVSTDGSSVQFADVLTKLNNENIQIARFTQKSPTLEDVFLTLIGEKKEAN